MLFIRVSNDRQQDRLEHETGPIEFGRGPQRTLKRCVVDDAFFSRDQLRVEELASGLVRLDNLSHKNALSLSSGKSLGVGAKIEVEPPVTLSLGKSLIEIVGAAAPEPAPMDAAALMTICQPVLGSTNRLDQTAALNTLGESPAPEQLASWLETIITLQRTSAGTPDFYNETTRALVELVGLDQGMVILREGDHWKLTAHHSIDPSRRPVFSKTLLNQVVEERQTFYQDINKMAQQAASLSHIAAVVVSPIFGLQNDVVGVLYGVRNERGLLNVGPIRPLEAQVVQLLAAGASANLARAVATRTRVQFEQFFSPKLVHELERDPGLLEGRDLEVTILVSDLRGFSSLSERLGPQKTCRLMRDMMERLSERIVEYGGVIVDYAGDGILAMWNAPALQEEHAVLACQAGLAMQRELPGLNETWHEMVGYPLRLGIGLNTGSAQVGNTGSSRKFKYGPHGHTVNIASRVQDTTKKLAIPLLITASTREKLPPEMATRRIGKVHVAGIRGPVELFELIGEDPPEDWVARREVYEKALDLYENRHFARACHTLSHVLELTRSDALYDAPTLKLMRQAWSCLEVVPEPFEPVIQLDQSK